ncbi:MAG TPA: alpha/beta hydrolase, partial [Acidimicrobiales bacterium]|nr:alpha/beta hydrolase [Acidimicrobiales bacterium]
MGHDSATLRWESVEVDGRRSRYGLAHPAPHTGSDAPPVLFLHGWGLTAGAYSGAIHELARSGHRVLAPDLPGFGGTSGLPAGSTTFPGYAAWVESFLAAAGVSGPVRLVGHSFGGGVAACSARLLDRRVRHLVLVNAVGGGAWTAGADGRVRAIAERPWWDWGLHFPGDLWTPSGFVTLPRVLGGAVPNFVRNPRAVLSVANLARTADLGQELSHLRRRGVRVSVVWSERDRIVPRANFEAMCQLLSVEGRVVRGTHAWMLGEPRRFARVVAELLDSEPGGRRLPAAMIRRLMQRRPA